MGVRPWNILSLCSGYGGLDLGIRLAVASAVTVCYVEREAYALANLVARIQEQALDDAPIWSDLRTFDGKPWRGVVDCVIGGYPCQPFSIAGKQRGADDPRHLWPDIARIVGEIRPKCCFFENVRQHINVGLDAVWADLRGMGYRVEGGIFSAAEVGAPHRRERLFLLAHAGRGGDQRWGIPDLMGSTQGTESGEAQQWQRHGDTAGDQCATMADTDETRLEGRHGPLGSSPDERAARTSSPALADAPDDRRSWGGGTRAGRSGLADDGCGLGIFPPGPAAFDEWATVLGAYPELAPALESPVRGVADGATADVAGRAEQLRLGGNGVVPLQAAYAFAVLSRRLGISDLVDVSIVQV